MLNILLRALVSAGVLLIQVDPTAATIQETASALLQSITSSSAIPVITPITMWTFLVTIALLLAVAQGRIFQAPTTALPLPRGGAAAAAVQHHNDGPLRVFVKTIKEARRHLVAAAVARSVSIFSMYPVDTIKTRIQMEQANALRLEGIYKGVGGSLLGQVPYGVLTFGSYEMYKSALLERFPNTKPILLYALAAVMGDMTGSGWLCPSEVVKQQMQADMFANTREAVTSIWKTKGLAGLYQGYWGGVARDVPFRVAQLTSYEVTKSLYLKFKQRRQEVKDPKQKKRSNSEPLQLSPAEAALCGAIAGTFSAAVTSPLDRIKTLLMTNSAAYGGSVTACAAKIWADEGLAGFCKGIGPRVVYIAPSVVIFFIAYEQVQQRLQHWKTT